MTILKLRGHHIESLERKLLIFYINDIPDFVDYDLSKFIEYERVRNYNIYNQSYSDNKAKIYKSLFNDNPRVLITSHFDEICDHCPYLAKYDNDYCTNPWGGYGAGEPIEEINKIMKEGDKDYINKLGYGLGDVPYFDKLLKSIISRNYCLFGFDSLKEFESNLDNIMPKFVLDLYWLNSSWES